MLPDVGAIAVILENRFRIRIDGLVRELDGDRFACLRPSDLEPDGGFVVAFSRSPRRIIASLVIENYAGPLIRAMGHAGPDRIDAFDSLRREAEHGGLAVRCMVDGTPAERLAGRGGTWNRFDLEVERAGNIGAEVETHAVTVGTFCLGLALALLEIEDTASTPSYGIAGLPEGAAIAHMANRYERRPENRAACIAIHGPVCQACGLEFSRMYGPLGRGYIEVHHRTPVSQLGEGYRIDVRHDLVPLCANCHAMVHATQPPLEISELRGIITASLGRSNCD
jgi:5-methylcytosine-specific restriction protein A